MAEQSFDQHTFYGQDLTWLKAYREDLKANLRANTFNTEQGTGDRNIRRAGASETAAILKSVEAEIQRQETILSGNEPQSGIITFAGFGGITH